MGYEKEREDRAAEWLPMLTVSAWVLGAGLRLRVATTDSKAYYPVFPYTNDKTSRDAVRGKDD
jgi:hypothetical protein